MVKYDRSCREQISRLVMEIIIRYPCLSLPLVKLPIVKDNNIGWPMAISPDAVLYNEEKLEGVHDETVTFILLHEAMHYVQKAPFRVMRYITNENGNVWSEEEAVRMNWALDLSVNDILVRAGVPRPHPKDELAPLIPGENKFRDFPRGKEVEHYYELLKQKQEEMEKEQQKQEEEKNDEKQDNGEEDEKGDSGEQEGEDGDDKHEAPEEGEEGDGEGEGEEGEGSGSDGVGDDAEESRRKPSKRNGSSSRKPDKKPSKGDGERSEGDGEEDAEEEREGGTGVARDGRLMGNLELEEMIREMVNYPVDIIPAQESDKADGKEAEMASVMSQMSSVGVGGHSNEFMRMMIKKELQPPKIPWKRQLQMLMTKKENARPTYTRPNRRRGGGDIIFPSRNNNTLGDTALVLDSSGSMTGFLGSVATECHSLISQFPNSVLHIIMGDTVVRKEETFRKGSILINPKDWEFKGGGGTEMQPLFKRAMELRVNAIICMTDLVFTFPPQPTVPVIWIVPEQYKAWLEAKSIVVPYGQIIWMEGK